MNTFKQLFLKLGNKIIENQDLHKSAYFRDKRMPFK